MRYPLLQAKVSQDRIRDLLEIGYRQRDKGNMVMAKDAFLKARELVNRTTGNKNVYRVINSELKSIRVAADKEAMRRVRMPG